LSEGLYQPARKNAQKRFKRKFSFFAKIVHPWTSAEFLPSLANSALVHPWTSEVNNVNDKQRAFAAAKANKNLHPALKGNPAPSPAPPPAAAEVKAKKGKPA
jgi:hypothetical protein